MEPGTGGYFITLICGGFSGDEAVDQAERLAEDGHPVISLCPDTTEQLRAFFRLSAALWGKLD